MATFFFRAVASDGKVRTGSLTAETDKLVARELRRQGLTPVYVGARAEEAASSSSCPSFGGGRRRDVLFFTQELSTLLNAGVPLDRALSHHRANSPSAPHFRVIVLGRSARPQGRQIAGRQPGHASRLFLRAVHQHGARRRSLRHRWPPIFERLAEFERSRDDLRSYIISSMIYPGAAGLRRPGVDLHPAEFRGAALRQRSSPIRA